MFKAIKGSRFNVQVGNKAFKDYKDGIFPTILRNSIDLIQASKRILTNSTVIALVLSTCCGINAFVGLRAFSTKYINTQFDVPVSQASMLAGIIIIPCAIFGNITGGIIVKKLKLQKRGMAIMAVMLTAAALVAIPFFFFAGCEQNPKAGLTVPYSINNDTVGWTLPDLQSTCNEDCMCPPAYRPVCGSDGITYTSPCHAGCSSETSDHNNTMVSYNHYHPCKTLQET
ncbi:putative solute carrier organic anion transporter family member 1A4 [Apostichopus japonicus]|uniref:Putative solute carrier organic anion transporter family member 1A4 n=1 Tax=Stichopus japonicus TaxID=307972 RepID=A0A2G8KW61_STIJA|nr:putative solute carrier organic anion transporter family member 1A4 [Apostichopus japonicus]